MSHTPFRNGAHKKKKKRNGAHMGSAEAAMEWNPEPNCRNLIRDRHELLTDGVVMCISRFASITKLWWQVSLCLPQF